jgi:hypothetical protein
MGAWGEGNFENDAALDWALDLQRSTGLSLVQQALARVLNHDGLIEVDAGCTALAAAEVVAALRGQPMEDLPEDVAQWLASSAITPKESLVEDCLDAVDKVRRDENSELRELWEEGEDPPEEWYSVLDDLTARLQ